MSQGLACLRRAADAWRLRSLAAPLSIVLLLQGCVVSDFLKDQKGTSIEQVKPAATRADVEMALGKPTHTWTTKQGVRYAEYRYVADATKPDYADAGAWVFLDAISLGLSEVFWFTPEIQKDTDRRRPALIAVAYDDTDHVIGVFPNITELTNLPEDGQALSR